MPTAPHHNPRYGWLAVVGAVVIVLPWIGAALAGRPLAHLWEFPPPLEIPQDYVRFRWWAAGALLALLAGLAWLWCRGARRHRAVGPPQPVGEGTASHLRARQWSWPGWGWAAVVWTVVWWAIAWTRFPSLSGVQPFTFFPLWLGFVVTMNALVCARRGSCLMLRAPAQWFSLFLVSGVFWWIFEWLNRFVRNWHYLGVEDMHAGTYAVHATLSFSTVLPAVTAVAEWLSSFGPWQARWALGPRWRWLETRSAVFVLSLGGTATLALTGAYPRFWYPALWASPLALLWALAAWRRSSRLPNEVAVGDWRRAMTWMLATLICGFFWEMWNVRSFAHWIYTVPGVERWHVFEMPLLGYLGYLPFGLQCLLVAERVVDTHWHVSPREQPARNA